MAIEIKAPTFPESVADGTVATWHKQPGDAVSRVWNHRASKGDDPVIVAWGAIEGCQTVVPWCFAKNGLPSLLQKLSTVSGQHSSGAG